MKIDHEEIEDAATTIVLMMIGHENDPLPTRWNRGFGFLFVSALQYLRVGTVRFGTIYVEGGNDQ
ncbi:MAG: hypothetical protein P8H65_06610 [Rhodothermales bacterium]|jgi:hypothetical protein|nr:hypothetical protein [Rhodothermales bacterium]MDG2015577.1 hypothetical protein [Rhodothermales bacterium]HAY37080.1 hypothetical protein [Bacteroidota bacterium]